MSKSLYNRYSLKENQLKKILIRVDYSGVTTIDNWVESIKSGFIKPYFASYIKKIRNNATMDFSNLEEISRTLSIPISEIIKEPIHAFSDSKFEGCEDKVALDITSLSLTLSINCVHYKNIDPYVKFMIQLIQKLLDSDSYIQIKRIGLRKIGGCEFVDMDAVYKVYEKDVVFCRLIGEEDIEMANREYTDRFLRKKEQIKVNYSRLCRNIRIKGEDKIQVILDMDGYVDDELIVQNKYQIPQDMESVLFDKINSYLFELFKNSVTFDYLKSHGHIE